VYKATFEDETLLAVKQLKDGTKVGRAFEHVALLLGFV
jgi:hypothetical protein